MKEINEIIRAFDTAQQLHKRTALATVVHVEGSSYKRPGARMLITEDGEITGAISGGCLEGDALAKALLVITTQQSMLITYDTTDEDDAKFGIALGCNGIIQVLIEPIVPSDTSNPIQLLKQIAKDRCNAVLVTLFSIQDKQSSQQGTCLLLKQNGEVHVATNSSPQTLMQDAEECLSNLQSSFRQYAAVTALIELIRPAITLVIAGAGNDAIPLATMANTIGWETIVADDRPSHAREDRFPTAKRIIVSKAEQLFDHIAIDQQTVFVLISHNYNYDKALIRQLLHRNTIYTGMLGPRKKLERMLQEFNEEGHVFNEQQLTAVYSPIGLDLGAETAEEIALAIIAEIKAVLTGKKLIFLKESREHIHLRALTLIEEKRLT